MRKPGRARCRLGTELEDVVAADVVPRLMRYIVSRDEFVRRCDVDAVVRVGAEVVHSGNPRGSPCWRVHAWMCRRQSGFVTGVIYRVRDPTGGISMAASSEAPTLKMFTDVFPGSCSAMGMSRSLCSGSSRTQSALRAWISARRQSEWSSSSISAGRRRC